MAAVAAVCHMTACVADLSNIKQRRNKTKQPFASAPVSNASDMLIHRFDAESMLVYGKMH
jgi:hypothetical protein